VNGIGREAGEGGGGRFRRVERLVRKGQFDAVFEEGVVFRSAAITVRARANGLGYSRLGLLVGRRCGGAVRRNRMKRLLRESFRRNRGMLSVGCDVVVIPRSGWRDLRLAGIEPVFREALSYVESALAG